MINEHTKDKQEVSSITWLFGFGVSWFIAWQVVKSIYELNDSALNDSGFVAIGAVMAVIYFSMTSKASLNKWGRRFLCCGVVIYGLLVIPVEVFSLFTNNISNSGGEELSQIREKKERAIDKIKKLELRQELNNQSKTMSDASKAYKNGQIDLLIKPHEKNANLIIPSNQGKAFDSLAGWLGVSNLEPIYKTVVAALLVFVMPLLNIARNGTWCGLTLLMHKIQVWFIGWIMEEKPVENKSVSPAGLKESGTQGKEPKVIDKFNGQLEATREWVESHPYGVELKTKEMRAMAKTSKQSTQNAIIAELYDNDKGILTRRRNGNQWKYSRVKREPKKAAFEQIKETGNLISLFKK